MTYDCLKQRKEILKIILSYGIIQHPDTTNDIQSYLPSANVFDLIFSKSINFEYICQEKYLCKTSSDYNKDTYDTFYRLMVQEWDRYKRFNKIIEHYAKKAEVILPSVLGHLILKFAYLILKTKKCNSISFIQF